ncbi:TPA: nucleoid-associated protein [Salmonella enterica subsp. enterica serovar Typhi]|uniref:Nucleoid-associated protein n=7 Tax=Salmonella enterica TaxID=28901 RepID=A0A725G1M4_SALEP|nr:hypothetical protein SM202186_07328 [Salmonella enterica subsp. enterica serovar Typhi]EAB2823634.1 nucleoid-associated protein [Salmonella enterica]EBH2516606.1 nucleoid-associated protein [Salmonella enterica subsp. enterica serovar Enteritidis]EBH8525701.1 nucleoid-associated protein [Salmonella enterica subsp. enterica serovar Typhi str. CR0044]ECF4399387.1 nucleoid-associated protein [Salmonella enterica subsp. enterica serovar Typhimurium]ECK9449740.1 nucleoid-associated protein [Salm
MILTDVRYASPNSLSNGDASERLSPEEGLVTEASQRLINDICAKYAGRTQFLGCNDVLIAKRESEKLRDVLKAFAAEKGLDGAEKDAFLKSAFEHLHALSKAGEPLSLETLVNAIWPQAPEELSGKLAAEELELSDGFVPDGRVIRALVSFKGKSKYWELKFDREGKTEGYIDYDPETNIITLRNVPEEFREMWMTEV